MRRTTTRCIKVGICITFLGFLGLQLFGSPDNLETGPSIQINSSSPDITTYKAPAKLNSQLKVSSSLSGERVHGLPNITMRTEGSVSELGKAGEIDSKNISEILRAINDLNKRQNILNSDKFGLSVHDNDTVVIVVQVHNRIDYLRELIGSLSQASELHTALLIFSHDVWDDEINALIQSITFVRTMQIFYPLSIQTHPKDFPGESLDDCPRNANKEQVKKLNCVNKDWPDIYGHYREAKFTQTKHHWWWKANWVFHRINILKEFQGLVLFLEEDHFLSKDFLPVLKLMRREKAHTCPNCDILCLGTYLKTYNFQKDGHQIPRTFFLRPRHQVIPVRGLIGHRRKLHWAHALFSPVTDTFQKVEITNWISAKHNMGMAFTRELWNKIFDCKSYFCNFDDYNWDWSLQHLSWTCFNQKIQVMLMKSPRVFHIGECGVHHKKTDCQASGVVKKVNDILSRAQKFLFPKKIEVAVSAKKLKVQKGPKGNGGWGDKRDKDLCMSLAS